ncbi:MAG: M50 family metallopeptidase, partial [Clostridiales bacterium]|nr:M50 family metallopeptidase [Clostridiales bacterium]
MKGSAKLRTLFRAQKKPADKTRGTKPAADITVRISPIMLIMATVFVAFGMAYEFACSLTAVVIHEFAHAKAAKKLGYALNEIKIMPYGAALCGSEDIRPKHEVMIAAAGPALNLTLGMIFAAMWWLIPSSYLFTETFCVCNLYIGFFNMLPVYPMDGGRVLFALLGAKLDRRKAYIVCRIISALVGLAAIALFAVTAVYAPNICFLNVGIFMVASAFIPDNRARYYALFARSGRRARLKHTLEKKVFAVSSSTTVAELCRTLDPDRFTQFDVYDDDVGFVASISEAELVDLAKTHGYEHNIGQLL